MLWYSSTIVSFPRPAHSKTGVQQGDPLGPLFFDLVLQRIVSAIDADDECQDLLYQAWYHDDGVLAGTKSALVQALTLIEELGPSFTFQSARSSAGPTLQCSLLQ